MMIGNWDSRNEQMVVLAEITSIRAIFRFRAHVCMETQLRKLSTTVFLNIVEPLSVSEQLLLDRA